MQITRDKCTGVPEGQWNERSRPARRGRQAWVAGALTALCTALLPGIAPQASATPRRALAG